MSNQAPKAYRLSPTVYTHLPIYAWLMALYPILFLYSQNIGNVFEVQVWETVGIALIAVTGVFGILMLITRSTQKAGVATAILALAFFSYGHVYNLLFAESPAGAPILVGVYALIVIAALVTVMRLRDASRIERASPYLNLMAGTLVIMTLPPIISYAVRVMQANSAAAVGEIDEGARVRNDARHPDVYYIVLDAYSANQHFLREWGYDNSAFTDALEQRGFTVAYDSKTSYGVTLPSVASVLNMRYFDDTDLEAARESRSDADYMREMIADSEVAQQFRSRGYSYLFMMSGFSVPSVTADVNIDFYPTGARYFISYDPTQASDQAANDDDIAALYQRPFTPLLLETTALREWADEAQIAEQNAASEDDPLLFWKPERAVMTWDEAERIPAIPEATFTVIHIIKPHEPIAFRRDGSLIPYPYIKYDMDPQVVESAFFEQLEYTNTRTLQMIDAILAQSTVPPIIVIQGDHGSELGKPESPDHRRTNFEILNAYHLGSFNGSACEVARDIIPINSFRTVFNCAFGTDYAMLNPRYYAMPDNYDDLFHFEEVNIEEWEAAHANGQ